MTIFIGYRLPNLDAYVVSRLSQQEDKDALVATTIKDNYNRGDLAYSLSKLGNIDILQKVMRDYPNVNQGLSNGPYFVDDKKKIIQSNNYSYLYQFDDWWVHIPNGGFNWLPLKDKTIDTIKEIETKKYNEAQKKYRGFSDGGYVSNKYILPDEFYRDLWGKELEWKTKETSYSELEKRMISSIMKGRNNGH